MIDKVISALTTGAFFIGVTMTLCWFWCVLTTTKQNKNQLLSDMEPLFLLVETQTINGKFVSLSRTKTLCIVFFGLGFLIWVILAFLTLLLLTVSPELLGFLLEL